MAINYNDRRFTDITKQQNADLKNVNNMYGSMINNSDKFYNDQIKASQDYANKQTQIQNQQTDFAIEKVEQQKEWAKQDYTKEQKGAYTDWQKQSNQYGANAEANAKMLNSGYVESSQVQMYTAYQNRVATARDSYNRAVVEYDNAIKDARLQNSAKLAEIAYQALQQKLELALQGFQYKNTLLQQKLTAQNDVKDRYYERWQDVVSQINTENALAEQVRQFNAQMALEREQFNWQKQQAAASSGSSRIYKTSGSSGSSSSKSGSSSKKTASINAGSITKKNTITAGKTPVGASSSASSVKSGKSTWYTLAPKNFGKLGVSGAPSQRTIDSLVSSGKLQAKVINGKMYYKKG